VMRCSPANTSTCSIAFASICFSTLSSEEKTKFCSSASPDLVLVLEKDNNCK
jgi:hypothetical protein